MTPSNYTGPGVFLEEPSGKRRRLNAPETVPVFIGYTEKAGTQNERIGIPTLISGPNEYANYFGGGPPLQFELVGAEEPAMAQVHIEGEAMGVNVLPQSTYFLYNSLRQFWQNKGTRARIISVGTYDSDTQAHHPLLEDLLYGIDCSRSLESPGIVILPDAVRLQTAEWPEFLAAAADAAATKKDRIHLLDIPGGYSAAAFDAQIAKLRAALPATGRDIVAAYGPWLATWLYEPTDFSWGNIQDPIPTIRRLIPDGPSILLPDDLPSDPLWGPKTALYKALMQGLADAANLQPVAGAAAGAWLRSEKLMGAWRPPAPTGISAVEGPAFELSEGQIAMLEQGENGYINPVLRIKGRGKATLTQAELLLGPQGPVSGIASRRLLQEIGKVTRVAMAAVVSMPNAPVTWHTVRNMLHGYLYELWKDGALQGKTDREAFAILAGLGTSMSQQDLETFTLRVTLKLAVASPGEFVLLTFAQEQIG